LASNQGFFVLGAQIQPSATRLDGKRILLIIGGGIAAYKALLLIRLLKGAGASVRCILTRAGAEFVTPLSLSALSGDKVYSALFDLTDEHEMGHIELSRDADLLVVAPATAHLMARMAAGLADDLATTALLATDKPVLCAPAMNVRMWQHPATQRNLKTLREDGVLFVGPDEGDMACGEYGPGRLAEPEDIFRSIATHFSAAGGAPLAGRHVLVTSGPTHEPIDPVRYIANRSSGKQGHAIAEAAARAGARVTLVSGPVSIPDPAGVTAIHVETAEEMLHAVRAALPADIGVFAAAVADWHVASSTQSKIKKSSDKPIPELALSENPDILKTVAGEAALRPRLVVGFAAETDDVLRHATEKRLRKGADWLVANDVSPESGVMGGDANTVHLITAEGISHWPPMSKADVASSLVAQLAAALSGDDAARPAKIDAAQ
jgi:phosphopantothenoylcysteine decarboxylase/phosphopantothenate--cysteine ligase